jgi:hypothetical protein
MLPDQVERPLFWISHTPEHDHLEIDLWNLGVTVQRTHLDDGDVRWIAQGDKVVLAELKTYSEALGSFTTERIRSQMWRCRQHADIPILLLYGYFSPTTEGFCQVRGTYKGESYSTVYIQYSAFRNFLAHLNTVGIITDEISRRDFTAKRLKALWGWTQKLDEESLTPGIQLPQVADKGEFMALRKLMVVDGWGQELASRMLALYGNSPWEAMKDLMDGDEKVVLKKLKGLGVGKKKLAQLRKEWINVS